MLASKTDCDALIVHRLLSILFISPVVGCTSPERRELNVAESATQLEERILTNPGLLRSAETVIPGGTVTASKNWDLDRLTLAAIYYHSDLAMARAQAQSVCKFVQLSM